LTADALLEGGEIWRERDAAGRTTARRADADCLFRGWRMAVLVGGADPAAPRGLHGGNGAELLAAALQDNGRAVVVGEPTAGDRFLRDDVRLPDNQGMLRMPVAVAERSAEQSGAAVRPDHSVAMKKHLQPWLEWRRLQGLAKPTDGKIPQDPVLDKAVEILRS